MEGVGGDGVGRQRLTLWDQMSAVENRRDPLAGLTLDDVLGSEKRSAASPAQVNRTLLDIIRDEEPHGHGSLFGHKDKKSWKAFRDRLRLRRTGSAWTSSVPIPTSDIPIQSNNCGYGNSYNNPRSLTYRRNAVRFTTFSSLRSAESNQVQESNDTSTVSSSRPQITRQSSVCFGSIAPICSESTESETSSLNIHAVEDGPPPRSFRPQVSRHNLEDEDEVPTREGTRRLAAALAEERSLSAREAIAAQEAAEAEAATQAAAVAAREAEEEEEAPNEGGGEAQQTRMSLMDLLEETDRQMGLEWSTYTMRDGNEEYGDEEEDDGEEDEGGSVKHTCCVCMVRHKGAAFIPCGHTFCRLCSRELWVQRGNCPLCNGFILEILDIF